VAQEAENLRRPQFKPHPNTAKKEKEKIKKKNFDNYKI
jgi:hypothetical protein